MPTHRLTGLVLSALLIATGAVAVSPYDDPMPPGGRPNPYQLEPAQLAESRRQGLRYALDFPEIEDTLVVPYRPIDRALRIVNSSFIARTFLRHMGIGALGLSWKDIFANMGLGPYPKTELEGPYYVPFAKGGRSTFPVGASVTKNKAGVDVLTFSCAACHSRNVFGRPILGVGNLTAGVTLLTDTLRPISGLPNALFRLGTGATWEETRVFQHAKEHLSFIGSLRPGPINDAAINAMAMTLGRREPDAFSSKTPHSAAHPKPTSIDGIRTDAKPGVWWVMKYKNKSQLDGSIVGNPIITDFLWNALFRGGDLKFLDKWLDENPDIVRDMTTAVYSAPSPRWTDFFPASSLNLEKAKRGELVFNQTCARCHGFYAKGWSEPNASSLSLVDQLATTLVTYHAVTPRLNVGTDPARADGMKAIAPGLNALAITKKHGLWVTPKDGAYVPPPLDGIWVRWPYFHNGSAASLCEVLTPAAQRTSVFYVGPPVDPKRDFDSACVGLPVGNKTPAAWKTAQRRMDTRRQGFRNTGHDEEIFLYDGDSIFGGTDRMDLIEYLKTL